MQELNRLTEMIIGCAIEVHRNLGPGLLEATYEEALCVELQEASLNFKRQAAFPILYKGRLLGEYRLDLLVEDAAIVEIKSVERFDPGRGTGAHLPKGDGKKGRSSEKFQFSAPARRNQEVRPLRPRPLWLRASVADS